MVSRSNFWHNPKGRMPAGPVRRTFHGDVEFSWGISAAVSSAASGVGAADEVGEAEGGRCDAEAEGEAEVVGSSVTVSVASGLSEAWAVARLVVVAGDRATCQRAAAHQRGRGEHSDDRAVPSGDRVVSMASA